MTNAKRVVLKFGDIAKQTKETADRDDNPFECYIEGGHLDSDTLRIKRWGYLMAITRSCISQIFRSGNILYGSRRTYLKGRNRLDFDGITANTQRLS